MKVSVIIGSYRPGTDLYRCLTSLINQTIHPDEIIIGVDTLQDEQDNKILYKDFLSQLYILQEIMRLANCNVCFLIN
jgi:GT2 family glycosyltransferase